MRRTRFITIMLVIIVAILVLALCVSIYYVFFTTESGFLPFFLDQDEDGKQDLIEEITRKYTRKVSGEEFDAEIYADGTMGIAIYTEGSVAAKMKNPTKLTGSIDKVDIQEVEYAYEVIAGKNKETTFVVLKEDGTVYYIDLDTLYNNNRVTLIPIDNLENIVRIYQTGIITDVEGYSHPYNVIAIDKNGKEHIITNEIISKITLP